MEIIVNYKVENMFIRKEIMKKEKHMKTKKLIAVLCITMGLTLSVPFITYASGSNTNTEQQLTPGWQTDDDGNRIAYVTDGKKVVGFATIDKKLYYFNKDGVLAAGVSGPQAIGENLYFFSTDADGSLVTKSFVTYNKKKYYADSAGKVICNAAYPVSGKIYCFDKNGIMLKNGMYTIGKNTYLLNKNGKAKVGKQKYQGKTYYFGSDGVMLKGVITYKGKLYFTSNKGTVRTGWFKSNGKRYYANSKGVLKTGWQKYKKKWYYFSPKKGYMSTGWVKTNGKYYYLDPATGAMKTGWFKVGSQKYYGTTSGSAIGARYTGLKYINRKLYIFTKKGALGKGWVTLSGKKYYASSKGLVTVGWRKIKNTWYYFESNGQIKTGWLVDKGNYYYMDPITGAMTTGTRTINGTKYDFGSSGANTTALSGSWSIRVNRACNVVTIYKGGVPVKAMLCSTGLNNATPVGNFRIMDKLYTHELNGPTWGYYCSHITSDILFHSLPAPSLDRKKVPMYKYNLLGSQASQGCIRLAMGDAYWLYTNCPIGSSVTVYHDAGNPGPLGKPKAVRVPDSPSYAIDPTDPMY